MYAVGIDGCSNGWLASYSKPFDFENCFCLYSKSLDELISKLPKRNLIIVDIPIGLEEKKHIRECDIKAREFIGPRRHSIFAPPCKKASLQNDYASANKLNKKITSYGLSKQTWMINEKLKETQKLIEKGYLLNEGHPECSFRELKGDFLQFGKRFPLLSYTACPACIHIFSNSSASSFIFFTDCTKASALLSLYSWYNASHSGSLSSFFFGIYSCLIY